MIINPGTEIRDYEIIRLIGSGGMSEVYLAKDNLDRLFAIKILGANLTRDPTFQERFRQEAKIMASLHHPNIVQLHSYFELDDLYCLVMEYVEGGSLKDLIKQTGPIPEERALQIFYQIAEALAYAHKKEIVHRDIKPSNIMFDKDGTVKVMDFGIARMKESEGMTKTGSRMGTLIYMSPEQIMDSKHVDSKTDIYSLGVTLYEMLTCRVPYDETTESDFNIMEKIVRQDLPDPRTVYPQIGNTTVDLIKKLTCRETSQRPLLNELIVGSFSGQLPTHPIPSGTADPDPLIPTQSMSETIITPDSQKKKNSATGWAWGFVGIIIIAIAILMINGNRPKPVQEEIMPDTIVTKDESLRIQQAYLEKSSLSDSRLEFTYKSIKQVRQMGNGSEFKVLIQYPMFTTNNNRSRIINQAISKSIHGQLVLFEGEIPNFGQDYHQLAIYLLDSWETTDEEGLMIGMEENFDIKVLLNGPILTLGTSYYGYWSGAHGTSVYYSQMYNSDGYEIDFNHLINEPDQQSFKNLLVSNYDSQYENRWDHDYEYKTTPFMFSLTSQGLLVIYEGCCTAEGFFKITIPKHQISPLLTEPYRSMYESCS